MYAQRRDGIALQPVVRGPGYESPSYGFVHTVDTGAILGNDVLHTFLINRNTDEAATIQIAPAGIQLKSIQSAELVTGPSADARNTIEQPNTICNQVFRDIQLDNGNAVVQLPPLSVAAISFNTNDQA